MSDVYILGFPDANEKEVEDIIRPAVMDALNDAGFDDGEVVFVNSRVSAETVTKEPRTELENTIGQLAGVDLSWSDGLLPYRHYNEDGELVFERDDV